ncbi:MAG: hypothetical protein KDA57_07100 [Planctomycetales bacterium]|nr:hypothetical protein [Planctomycetales bacterium]
MGALVRIMFPLIAYFCVGTVVTLGAAYGYLRFSGKLDDERMFRIVSLLHGVNLEEIAETYEKNRGDVPPEEPSIEQREEEIQLAVLLRQGKRDDLKNLNNEFDTRYKLLTTQQGRFENYKDEVEVYLEQRKAEAIKSGIVAVRSQLQMLIAKKQAKPLIIQMVDDDRMDDVILLLNGMSAKSRRDILRTFDSEEEIQMVYKIQERILQGDPERSFIDDKLQELQEGKQQDQ